MRINWHFLPAEERLVSQSGRQAFRAYALRRENQAATVWRFIENTKTKLNLRGARLTWPRVGLSPVGHNCSLVTRSESNTIGWPQAHTRSLSRTVCRQCEDYSFLIRFFLKWKGTTNSKQETGLPANRRLITRCRCRGCVSSQPENRIQVGFRRAATSTRAKDLPET